MFSAQTLLSFEVFGLALDGINSESLSVVHLHADNNYIEDYKPNKEYGVGINEMLVVQLLLDNCKNVDEAKEFLLCNKHFYMLIPTHLLISDKHGKSFVWEHTLDHNKEIIIDGTIKANRNITPAIFTIFCEGKFTQKFTKVNVR